MLVSEFLEKSAAKYPDKVALVCDKKRLTFRQVEESANRISQALLDYGLEKQGRVAIFLEPSVEAVVSIFATLKAGGIFLVINLQVKAKKIEYILNDCQVRILITDQRHLAGISGILTHCPSVTRLIITDYGDLEKTSSFQKFSIKVVSYFELLKKYPALPPKKRCIDIDLASLIYTSGSTGTPKGVMLTHLNMVSAANSIIEYLENTPSDIILNVLPLSFDYGLYQVLMTFKFGGTVVQEKSFLYPYQIIDLIIKEKITGFPIVPTIAALLLKLRYLQKYDFSTVRYITNTAQALPPKYIPQLQEIFPRARIYSMYGLTECKRVSYLPPEELEKRPTSVGKAMPNTEAYIVDKEGKRIEEPGKVGELVVRGANVMKGYWNLAQETEKVLRPGPIPGEKVLYTGDLFRMDEDGFLYFISRKDDIIKVAGERVSPKEIENALHNLDGVSEAAVIGVDDEILGKAVKAFIVLKKGSKLTEEDILRHCSAHLENYMIPKFIEFRKELPKSAHGKISKKDLR
ncbi:MAG: AMP-binding protein [Clostridiales bacterium]|nr:AMP-binding protein [Clostridiales bacterium]